MLSKLRVIIDKRSIERARPRLQATTHREHMAKSRENLILLKLS